MFEEDNANIRPASARSRACLRQCRLAQFINGKSIEDGGCTCETPVECRFHLSKHVADRVSIYEDFPDVARHIRELWSE